MAVQSTTQIKEEALKTLGNIDTNPSNGVITQASNPDTALANQGYVIQVDQEIQDYLGPVTPMVDVCFKYPTLPLVYETLQIDYILPAATVTTSMVQPGQAPIDSAMVTQSVIFGYGKKFRRDSILKEKLMARYNQMKILNAKFESDGIFAHPVEQLRRNMMNLEMRDLNNNLYSGTPDGQGYGIVGLKPQFLRLNTTSTTTGVGGASDNIPTTGTADNSYDKTFWTNTTAGKAAWAADVFNRVNLGMQYGAGHYTAFVPLGSGITAKNALIAFQQNNTQSTMFFTIGQKGIPTEGGSYLSPFGNKGRYYVNDMIDVVETQGPATAEVVLYADIVNGGYSIETYEFVAGYKPRGYRTLVSVDNQTMKDLAGLGDYDQTFFTPLYTGTNYESLFVAIQWTGQVAFVGVPLSTLYTQANFLITGITSMLPDTNTSYTQVSMKV